MRKLTTLQRGWAKLTLGISLLFAVGIFVYLSITGSPWNGVAVGGIIIVAGIWEYRRKLQDEITAERYESKAEERRRRNQQ